MNTYLMVIASWGGRLLYVSAAILSIFLASTSRAQEPSTNGANAPSSAQEGAALAAVVVTATKMGSGISVSPVSAATLNADDLAVRHITNIQDVASSDPSLVYSTSAGYGQPFIRGVGSNFATLGIESSVATYVDGVYLERQGGSMLDLIDVSSVTVLNGPQGTLYGRNATGGVILIETADPENALGGNVEIDYGNFNQGSAQAVLNIPLTSTLAVRFSAEEKTNGGYLEDLNTGEKVGNQSSSYFHGKIRWAPTEHFTAIYGITYYNLHSQATQQAEILPAPYCVACAVYPGVPLAVGRGFYVATQTGGLYNNNNFTQNTLNLAYSGSAFTVTSISGFRNQNSPANNDLDGVGPNFFYGQLSEFGHTFTNDTYLRTKFNFPLNGLIGASILRDGNDTLDFPFGGDILGGATAHNLEHYRISSYSGYGELTYDFGGGFKVTAGGRLNHDAKTISVTNDPLAVIALGLSGVPSASAFEKEGSWNSFTPRAVLSYENHSGYYYASYNRGEKSGAFPSPLDSPLMTSARPERLDSFEIGAKNTLLGGRMRTTFDVFYGLYKDIQVQTVNGETASIILQNAASARMSGVEFTSHFDVAPGLEAALGATYEHNYFVNFPNAAIYSPGGTPGCPVPAGGLGLSACTENLSGSPLPRSPRWSGYFSADYSHALPNGWSARLSGNLHTTSKFDFDAGAGGPLGLDLQKGYTAVDASLTGTTPDGKMEIGAYVKNMFQAHYYDYASTGSLFTYYVPPMPRSFGVRVSYKF